MQAFNPILETEKSHSILGVPGRYLGLTVRHDEKPDCFCSQKWVSERRPFPKYHKAGYLQVEVRFDDGCRNGHNTFTITADASHPGACDIDAGGCLHEDIAKVFPELAGLIKWHLVSSDGPMHYEANTIYHASDRDCHGLKAGESKQIKNGKSGLPSWKLATVGEDGNPCDTLPAYIEAADQPTQSVRLAYVPWCRVGEGKVRELNFARSSACWPEATDKELTAPGLRERLAARLPKLLEDFRATIAAIGFRWSA